MINNMDKVASMISAIGTERFGAAMLGLVDARVGVSHCTAFEQIGNNPPQCLLADGLGNGEGNYARQLARQYVEDAYCGDPILRTLHQVARPTPAVDCFDPHDFQRAGDNGTRAFIQQYYFEPRLAQEAIFSVKDGDRLLWVSLYKPDGGAAFNQDERRELGSLSGVILAGVSRQVQLLDALSTAAARQSSGEPDSAQVSDSAWGQATRAETLIRVRSALLMDPCSLTQREAEICAHIVVGYQVLAISLRLDISINTVATHRKRAYAKLGISSQTELFHVCLKHGLLH